MVVISVLDFLTFALCAPYSETTDGAHFDALLGLIAKRGRELFRLLQHPSLSVVKGMLECSFFYYSVAFLNFFFLFPRGWLIDASCC